MDAEGRKTGGRKKGVPNKKTKELQEAVAAAGITPLDYMLQVMRDEKEDQKRRDWAAEKSAPYLHAKLAAVAHSGSIDLNLGDRLDKALGRK